VKTPSQVRLLALDTTEAGCSAALWFDGQLSERYEVVPRRHSERLLPMMDSLLRDAGVTLQSLDAVAFARGPGSFTGLRIAASVAQGAAFGAGLPVVPVSSLQALARGICREAGASRVLAALDARMDEVYWGVFECAGDQQVPTAVVEEAVGAPDAVEIPPGGDWHAVGSGWAAHAAALIARTGRPLAIHEDRQVHAADVAWLAAREFVAGRAVPAEQALPVYLRDKVAWARS
jgi:tRNA threonylcarbamoyladenosine biosynthesis protein TsaB